MEPSIPIFRREYYVYASQSIQAIMDGKSHSSNNETRLRLTTVDDKSQVKRMKRGIDICYACIC